MIELQITLKTDRTPAHYWEVNKILIN